MIAIDKEHHECQITDFAIPYDTSVDEGNLRRLRNTWIWVWN